jgi:hypothetical protein
MMQGVRIGIPKPKVWMGRGSVVQTNMRCAPYAVIHGDSHAGPMPQHRTLYGTHNRTTQPHVARAAACATLLGGPSTTHARSWFRAPRHAGGSTEPQGVECKPSHTITPNLRGASGLPVRTGGASARSRLVPVGAHVTGGTRGREEGWKGGGEEEEGPEGWRQSAAMRRTRWWVVRAPPASAGPGRAGSRRLALAAPPPPPPPALRHDTCPHEGSRAAMRDAPLPAPAQPLTALPPAVVAVVHARYVRFLLCQGSWSWSRSWYRTRGRSSRGGRPPS